MQIQVFLESSGSLPAGLLADWLVGVGHSQAMASAQDTPRLFPAELLKLPYDRWGPADGVLI